MKLVNFTVHHSVLLNRRHHVCVELIMLPYSVGFFIVFNLSFTFVFSVLLRAIVSTIGFRCSVQSICTHCLTFYRAFQINKTASADFSQYTNGFN